MEASWRSNLACWCPVGVKYVIIVILVPVVGTGESVVETKLFFALYVLPYTYFYCVILIQYCLFKWFLFIIHQLALTLFLVIYVLLGTNNIHRILSFIGLNRIHG